MTDLLNFFYVKSFDVISHTFNSQGRAWYLTVPYLPYRMLPVRAVVGADVTIFVALASAFKVGATDFTTVW